MTLTLLNTKFFRPAVRPNLVSRQRLVERLNQKLAQGSQVSLVCAPAGYGKTTLTAAWLESLPAEWKVAWLSLDSQDNHPQRFWLYVMAALRRQLPEFGEEIFQLLRSSADLEWLPLLTELLNALSELPGKTLLVLDDLHLITEPGLFESMAFFIEHLPPDFHLAVTTRVDPPLPLARLRARGLLGEIRAADLVFNEAEAAAFFQKNSGKNLRSEEVQTLLNLTEGWAAGLQMVSLSMEEDDGRAASLPQSGDRPHAILDYFFNEVLARQTADTQKILLATAVLERFSTALAAEMVAILDPDLSKRVDSAFLRSLENANLFLVALDEKHTWYRYHHLFADLLQQEVRQRFPDQLPALHAAAARWHWLQWQQHNQTPGNRTYHWLQTAMKHIFASGDLETATDWFLQNWQQMAHESQIDQVLTWLNSFPPDWTATHARLNGAYAWTLWLKGRYRESEDYLYRAFALIDIEPTLAGVQEIQFAYHDLLTLLSFYTVRKGNFQEALAIAQKAVAEAPEHDHLACGVSGYSLANLLRIARQYGPAQEQFVRAYPELMLAGNFVGAAACVFQAAQIWLHMGQLSRAEQFCREAIAQGEKAGIASFADYGSVYTALGSVLLVRGAFEEGYESLQEGLNRLKFSHVDEMKRNTYRLLWQLESLRGREDAAREAVEQMESIAQRMETPFTRIESQAYAALHALESGSVEKAYAWLDGMQNQGFLDALQKHDYLNVLGSTLSRILLHQKKTGLAAQVLKDALESARADGRDYDSAELLLWQALLHLQNSQREAAETALAEAVQLSAPGQLVSIFMQADPAVQKLLIACQPQNNVEKVFIERVLQNLKKNTLESSQPGGLIEPLTERELEILNLIVQGYANQEIADTLFITLFTVKKHISNILGKLGVTSRTQAAARARSLGLV